MNEQSRETIDVVVIPSMFCGLTILLFIIISLVKIIVQAVINSI